MPTGHKIHKIFFVHIKTRTESLLLKTPQILSYISGFIKFLLKLNSSRKIRTNRKPKEVKILIGSYNFDVNS